MDNENNADAEGVAKRTRAPKEAAATAGLRQLQAADAALLAEGAEIKAGAKMSGVVLVTLTTSRLLNAATRRAAPRGSLAAVAPDQLGRLTGRGFAREATDREVARWSESGRTPVKLQKTDED